MFRPTLPQSPADVAPSSFGLDSLPIAPAERYDAVVVADHPGAWFFSCMQPGHVEAGERMLVVYDGHAKTTPPDIERGIAA